MNPSLVAAGHNTSTWVSEMGVLIGTGDFKCPGKEIFVSLAGLNRSFHFSTESENGLGWKGP